VEMLQFFNMVAVHHLGFLKFDFFYPKGPGRPTCISIPNSSKIGQKVLEISWFFGFSRWWLSSPPSWSLEMLKFYSLMRSRDTRCITVSKIVKIGQSVAEILQFFDFSRWQPSVIWDVWGTSGIPTKSTWRSLLLCKIWLWLMQQFW